MLQQRLLKDEDYPVLCEWWADNNFPAPPKEMLPQNGLGGVMITKKGIDICAGFIYTTNSKIAWMEFIVANYNYREKDRKEAIMLLIDNLCYIAQNLGFKAVFSSVKNPFLINHFKNSGFSVDCAKSTEMVKRL